MEWQHTALATTTTETADPRRELLDRDHEVGLTEARELIARSKRANPGQPSAGAIGRAALDALLAQQDCAGIRIYYGQKDDGTRTLVLVGMDEMGNDLDEGLVFDRFLGCPPFCALNSALDS
jgi:hypothetical protein